MTSEELYEWMADTSLMTKSSLQELRQMMNDYPFFHTVRMLYLKNLAVLQDVCLEKELKKMSVYIPDRRQLYTLIYEQPLIENKNKQPEYASKGKASTEAVIDIVENALPASESDEKDFVSTLIPKPVSPVIATSDYANWLAQNTDNLLITDDGGGNQLQHQHLIDSFMALEGNQLAQRLSATVEKTTSEQPAEEETPASETKEKSSIDDSYFTETLARVYMSQKRYDKALEIIQVLSLKYPKKNRYFADQIRYLEKIININKK